MNFCHFYHTFYAKINLIINKITIKINKTIKIKGNIVKMIINYLIITNIIYLVLFNNKHNLKIIRLIENILDKFRFILLLL